MTNCILFFITFKQVIQLIKSHWVQSLPSALWSLVWCGNFASTVCIQKLGWWEMLHQNQGSLG